MFFDKTFHLESLSKNMKFTTYSIWLFIWKIHFFFFFLFRDLKKKKSFKSKTTETSSPIPPSKSEASQPSYSTKMFFFFFHLPFFVLVSYLKPLPLRHSEAALCFSSIGIESLHCHPWRRASRRGRRRRRWRRGRSSWWWSIGSSLLGRRNRWGRKWRSRRKKYILILKVISPVSACCSTWRKYEIWQTRWVNIVTWPPGERWDDS